MLPHREKRFVPIDGRAPYAWTVPPRSLLTVLLDELCYQSGPTGLMAGPNARAIVAVEAFMKWYEVATVGIVVKFVDATKDRPAHLLVSCKNTR